MSADKVTPRIWTVFLAALVLSMMPFYALAANAPAPAQAAVDQPNVARISDIAENAFILGKSDVNWSYAENNLVVEEGDLFQTDETGRVEVQFQGGVTFRIGENSRVAVLEIGQSKVIGMDGGSGYLRVADEFQRGNKLQITFPTGQITAEEPALARIDVRDDKSAEIRILRGNVAIESISQGAQTIDAGRVVLIRPDGSMQISTYNLARADSFDKWNEERDIALSTYRRPEYIEQNITGAQDLNGYGRWVYMDRYNNYGWQPYVVESWRPYYYGHWSYSSAYGWMWVPEEPWGYVTYHYGSWNYEPNYGWVWIPGYVWRPSHVYWIDYDDYIGWVPLNYYGYPVITTYPYYVTSYYPGYIDFFSFTFVYGHYFPFYDHRYYYHHDHDWDHHGHWDHDHDDWDHDGDHHGDHDHDGDDDHHDGDFDHDHGDDREIHHGHNVNDDDRNVAGTNKEFNDDDENLHKSYAKLREDFQKFKDNPAAAKDAVRAGASSRSKAAFMKNLNEKGLAKPLAKGRLVQQTDFSKYLDTKNHPEIAKKVTRLNQQVQIKQTKNAAAVFAAAPAKNQFKSLDYRKQILQNQNRTIKSKAANPAAAPQALQQQNVTTPGQEQKNQNIKMTPAPSMRDMQKQRPSAPGQLQKSMQPQQRQVVGQSGAKNQATQPLIPNVQKTTTERTIADNKKQALAATRERFMKQQEIQEIKRTLPAPQRTAQPAVNPQRSAPAAADSPRYKSPVTSSQRANQPVLDSQRHNGPPIDSQRYSGPATGSQGYNMPAKRQQLYDSPNQERYSPPLMRQNDRQIAPRTPSPAIQQRSTPSRSYGMQMPAQSSPKQQLSGAYLQHRQSSPIAAAPSRQSGVYSQPSRSYSAPSISRASSQRSMGSVLQSSGQSRISGGGGRTSGGGGHGGGGGRR